MGCSHQTDALDPQPGVESKPPHGEIGDVATGEHAKGSADDGAEGEVDAGVLLRVVLVEEVLRVVRPRVASRVPDRGRDEEEHHGGLDEGSQEDLPVGNLLRVGLDDRLGIVGLDLGVVAFLAAHARGLVLALLPLGILLGLLSVIKFC